MYPSYEEPNDNHEQIIKTQSVTTTGYTRLVINRQWNLYVNNVSSNFIQTRETENPIFSFVMMDKVFPLADALCK